MNILSRILTFNNNIEELKLAEFKCKGEALRSIILYFTKYREDVQELVQTFSFQIFEACLKISDNDASNKVPSPHLNSYFPSSSLTL